MKLVLIRHGAVDYTPVNVRGFIGHGRDLAPLSEEGIHQAERVAHAPELAGCQLILASPYTRAMQTAAIISRGTGLDIHVEVDLHEWLPDKTYRYLNYSELDALRVGYARAHGVCPPGTTCRWETVDEMNERLKPVLDRWFYKGFQRLAVVCHGMVISRLTGIAQVEHCTPYVIDYDEHHRFHGFVT